MIRFLAIFLTLFLGSVADSGQRFQRESGVTAERRREPNNVQCFKNQDCISDCCISSNGWVGVCVGRPTVGQICGLFTPPAPGQKAMNQGSQQYNNWMYSGVMASLLGSHNGVGQAAAQAAQAAARAGGTGVGLGHAKLLASNIPAQGQTQVQTIQHGHYPVDARISAYQQAGGYGGYGSNKQYYGLGSGK